MSIQLVGSIGSLWRTIKNDFKTFSQDLTAFQTSQKSGSQDQTSQNALQQAITSLLNDITNVQSSAAGTTTGATNGSNAGQATNPLQALSQDLTAFQSALNSGDQNQIQSLENTLQNDISALQSYSYYRHHYHIANGANNGASYVNANSQQQSTTASSVNLTV
jgi:Sec-independent protein translocase protein TatA